MPYQQWKLHPRWVYVSAAFFFFLYLFFWGYTILYPTNGAFVYPYDEAYLRMATGKNLAFNGYWGLSGHEFAPASSSLLYPMILSVFFKIFGVQAVLPFLVNLIAALILLWVVQQRLRKEGLLPWGELFILLFLIIIIPLPVLVFIGMEHTLQILFSFLLIYKASDALSDGKDTTRNILWQVYVYGFLAVAIRYEGIFLVAAICIYFLIRRRWVAPIILATVSALPIVIFGVYSLSQGGYFLPNSILLKALPVPLNIDNISHFLTNEPFVRLFLQAPTPGNIAIGRLIIILPLTYTLIGNLTLQYRKYRVILMICLVVTVLHLLFASSILYYRYEAYLLACGMIIPCTLIAIHSKDLFLRKVPVKLGVICLTVILFYPILARSWYAFKDTSITCKYNYQRDFQAMEFLHKYYDHATLIMDDIGMATYATNARIIDLTSGVGNMELTNSIEGGYFRSEYIDYQISKYKPSIALISERGFSVWIRQHWVKVASWRTTDIVPTKDPEIYFYAVAAAAAPALKKNLQTFEAALPPEVKVTYY